MKWISSLTFLLIVGVVIISVLKSGKQEQLQIRISTAKIQEINASLFVSGTVMLNTKVTLSSEVIAKVIDIKVTDGERVKIGQPLIQLDREDVDKEIELAMAQLRKNRIQEKRIAQEVIIKQLYFDKLQRLREAEAIDIYSEDIARTELAIKKLDLESAKENVIQAMSQLALAKQKAEKTIIKSPINGTVIATRIKEGETAISSTLGAAGSELMLIADLSDYSIMAYISEFDISRISVGQSAIVKLNNNPQQLLTGKIVHVATMLNASYKNEGRSKNDRQIAVEISFKAHDNEQLYAGMGAELEILESQSSPITVPLSAVLYDEKTDKERTYIAGSKRNYFLYTIEDNIVVKKMVELGVSDRSLQEIRKGIQVGERVIYGPAKFLNSLVEGDTVTDHSTNNQRVVNKSAINDNNT